ncbi:hypothetical protein [Alicyclobacillus macrosporangiidus]|uniref:Uncharacterized protein n=1 Tax=Alicyclobacillus macrosporangiidus TaxID=392015 RepID=A0A1I7KC64_9BACL|nr:hypothetical protein [Alicyclobacillus macrosporangiidus]SFU95054.1 hypothetical protein SAMN05421543_11523 [Alicyclobacillus macrosporangiidus]
MIKRVLDEDQVKDGKRQIKGGILRIFGATLIAILWLGMLTFHSLLSLREWLFYLIVALAVIGLAKVFYGRWLIEHAEYELDIPPMPDITSNRCPKRCTDVTEKDYKR